MTQVRLLTLDPAHFHAALLQKEMYPQVDPTVHVYAPLTTDLTAHLNRIVGFNTRKEKPTNWQVEVHSGPDFLERAMKEKPGNVVILSGRNHVKIDYILQSVQAGLNVLADKPWVLTPDQLPKLQQALDLADQNGLIIFDMMTERYEITSMLQRELVNDPTIFGTPLTGSPEDPGFYVESIHFLMKKVAGVPLRRPEWYFDVNRQGEGLNDVGTHLVDLVPWMYFPEQTIDVNKDVKLLSARRWPTVMSKADFHKVTGESEFPSYLDTAIQDDKLNFFCNTSVTYTVRGIHAKLDVLWNFEAASGEGDTHVAITKGSKASVEIRQGKEQNYRPELYVVPQAGNEQESTDAITKKVAQLQGKFPGISAVQSSGKWHFIIPEQYRVGHEAHFAEVGKQFLRYLENPKSLPAWEKPHMLAKYFVTTQGVALSRLQR
jgi:predicted dehydrogenase